MTESVSLTAAASSCLTMLGGEWTLTNSVLLALTAVTLLSYIWVARNWSSSFEGMRDVTCPLPLPPGSMGYPYIGESLEFIRKFDPRPTMEALINKIKRGSFEPIPLKFNAYIRDLIATLLTPEASDRPNINDVLKTNLLMENASTLKKAGKLAFEYNTIMKHPVTPTAKRTSRTVASDRQPDLEAAQRRPATAAPHEHAAKRRRPSSTAHKQYDAACCADCAYNDWEQQKSDMLEQLRRKPSRIAQIKKILGFN